MPASNLHPSSTETSTTEDAPLFQIVYVSSATKELTEDALMTLLKRSRARNLARGITGLLLHVDGNLIHIIEGPEHTTLELFDKIKNDSRHRGLMVLAKRHISERDFPDYHMGFKREKTTKMVGQIPGFTDIVEKRKLKEHASRACSHFVATLLKTFARTTRLED